MNKKSGYLTKEDVYVTNKPMKNCSIPSIVKEM